MAAKLRSTSRPGLDDVNDTIELDSGWTLETSVGSNDAVYRCIFELQPLDYCARYLLHIDTPADQLRVRLRGEDIASGPAPFQADVTDYLSLDDNQLELIVLGNAAGEGPGDVWLEAVPCDEQLL
jgi:hypothetical protein